MKRNVFRLLLALVMLLAILPGTALATEEPAQENIDITQENTTVFPDNSLQLRSPASGLYYRTVWKNNGSIGEDPVDGYLSEPLELVPQSRFKIALYYYDGQSYAEVTDDSQIRTNLDLEPEGSAAHYYDVIAPDWDDGYLRYYQYEDLLGELTAKVDLPNRAAAYAAPQRTEENYLFDFDLDRTADIEDRTIYLMAEDGFGPISQENSVTISLLSDNSVNFHWSLKELQNGETYIELVPDAVSDDRNLALEITDTSGRNHRIRLRIHNATPGLYYRYIDQLGNNEGSEDQGDELRSNPFRLAKSWSNTIALYWFDGTDYIPVTNATGDEHVRLQRLVSDDHHYLMVAEEWGEGAIRMDQGNGSAATIPVHVQLDECGLFSRQEFSVDAVLDGCYFNRDPGGETAVGFMKKDGLTAEEAAAFSVDSMSSDLPADAYSTELVPNENSTAENPLYDLKINILTGPEDLGWRSYNLEVSGRLDGRNYGLGFGISERRINNNVNQRRLEDGATYDGTSYYSSIGNVPFVTGIYTRNAGGDIITMVADEENNWSYLHQGEKGISESWGVARAIEYGAAIKAKAADGTTVYTLDRTLSNRMILNSARLEYVDGKKEDGKSLAFSLSATDWVTEWTPDYEASHSGFRVYWSSLYAGSARLVLNVTLGSETFEISALLRNEFYETVNETRPSNDSVVDLNHFIEDFAREYEGSDPQLLTLYLQLNPEAEYEGLIYIPRDFPAEIMIRGDSYSGRTTLMGSLRTRSEVSLLQGIDFIGPGKDAVLDDEKLSWGISGNTVKNIYECSFRGYSIALNSTQSCMTPTRDNVFIDNGIAVLLDMVGARGSNREHWSSNRYLNNDVGIRVLSLQGFFTPFYLRVSDSDFIDNGVDFDFQNPQGNYYLYRNYYAHTENATPDFGDNYGDYWDNDLNNDRKLDCDRTYRTPITTEDTTDGILLVTNPRRLHSILHNDDSLWIDVGRIVEVLLSEADNLIIDEDALVDQEEDVEIKVRDEEQNVEGSWHFKGDKGGNRH